MKGLHQRPRLQRQRHSARGPARLSQQLVAGPSFALPTPDDAINVQGRQNPTPASVPPNQQSTGLYGGYQTTETQTEPTQLQDSQMQFYSGSSQATYMAAEGTPAGDPTSPTFTPSSAVFVVSPSSRTPTASSHPINRVNIATKPISSAPPPSTTPFGSVGSVGTGKPTTMTAPHSTGGLTSSSSFHPTTFVVTSPRSSSSTSNPNPGPSPTGLLDGEPPNPTPTTSISGTAIAAIIVFLGIASIIVIFFFRSRYLRKKEKEARVRRAQLERDYMATKESSIFGGKDWGGGESEKAAPASESGKAPLASGPSWVDGFMDTLQVPGASQAPAHHGRFSKRGSGWMVLGDPASPRMASEEQRAPPLPTIRFADDQRFKKRGEYDTESRESAYSTEEDAIIATASRVSAASVYTTKSFRQPPTSYNSISPYAINKSPSDLSNVSYGSYHQEVYKYESDAGRKVGSKITPPSRVVAPANTLIGAAVAPNGNGGGYQSSRSRGEMDGFKDDISTAMARAREPLRVTKKTGLGALTTPGQGSLSRAPSRSYHTSTTRGTVMNDEDDEDPFVHDRDTLRAPPMALSPDSRHSMGTLMMTHYDDEGSITPAFMESPVLGGSNVGDERNNGGITAHRIPHPYGAPHPSGPNASRSLGASTKYTNNPQEQYRNGGGVVPKLTIISPTGAQVPNAGSLAASSSSALLPLSQMALANAQPNYRSPTYSIYNMYDGDDEGRVPRRSVVASARSK